MENNILKCSVCISLIIIISSTCCLVEFCFRVHASTVPFLLGTVNFFITSSWKQSFVETPSSFSFPTRSPRFKSTTYGLNWSPFRASASVGFRKIQFRFSAFCAAVMKINCFRICPVISWNAFNWHFHGNGACELAETVPRITAVIVERKSFASNKREGFKKACEKWKFLTKKTIMCMLGGDELLFLEMLNEDTYKQS